MIAIVPLNSSPRTPPSAMKMQRPGLMRSRVGFAPKEIRPQRCSVAKSPWRACGLPFLFCLEQEPPYSPRCLHRGDTISDRCWRSCVSRDEKRVQLSKIFDLLLGLSAHRLGKGRGHERVEIAVEDIVGRAAFDAG